MGTAFPAFQMAFGNESGSTSVKLGEDFRLDEDGVVAALCASLTARERDLLRLGMAVYVADRRVKRNGFAKNSIARSMFLHVEMADAQFWNQSHVRSLLQETLEFLSGDIWELSFIQSPEPTDVGGFLTIHVKNPIVCLYSGGLDSAAGLAAYLPSTDAPIITVTALHQHGQRRRVQQHVDVLKQHFHRDVFALIARTTLKRPPVISKQELTQRGRAFLFVCLGGAVASRSGAEFIEVFESGVGALNLPHMDGMVLGARTTKGCHPHFLRQMSRLLSLVSDRSIQIRLPFADKTKAEIVRSLNRRPLLPLAFSSVSCVHYPRRVPGQAKQCGCCLGCIGRRQSLLSAGILEDPRQYGVDLFSDAATANTLSADDLQYLKVVIMQVAHLNELNDSGTYPSGFKRHFYGTQVLDGNESVGPWINAMRRYRHEWLELIELCRKQGLSWASWLSDPISSDER